MSPLDSEDYRIVIPTHRRRNGKTYRFFKESGFNPFLVIKDEEDLPVEFDGWWTKQSYPDGIRGARQTILETFYAGKVLTFDDDLTFFRRGEDGRLTELSHGRQMIADILSELDHYPLVGVHERFMADKAPPKRKIAGRMIHVTCWNRALWAPGFNPRYNFPTGEDHDFHFQFLTTGHTSSILTDYAHDDKENAPGGCSEWREHVLQDVSMLEEKWGRYVRINAKGRPVIYFKKAWKEAQK